MSIGPAGGSPESSNGTANSSPESNTGTANGSPESSTGPASGSPGTITDLLTRMRGLAASLADTDPLLGFLATYTRTTLAVASAVASGGFEDPGWVERWDLAFADIYLTALRAHMTGGVVTRPWRLAFGAAPTLPPLRSLLLGMNAHINYDLPQALVAIIPDADFADPAILDRRRRDHERIDAILAGRVSDEDAELSTRSRLTWTDHAMRPLNQWATKRFLRESRSKVWANALELSRARTAGEDAYAARLRELEVLSAAKIAELLAPGQVLLRLAVAGFGVTLPPPG